MSELNANIPYIKCFLRKEFFNGDEDLEGYIFGAKCMINNPMLFHFQGSNGALFWNISINYFCHRNDYDGLSTNEQIRLQLLESWDCQSSAIAVTTFKFLEHKMVDVRCRDKKWRRGIYLFTIDDFEGDSNILKVGYSSDLDSKCFHFIKLDDGNFCIQPNNLLRWHNPDFIVPYQDIPKIKLNNVFISSEHIDRTYGNSPYYFYENDSVKSPN